MRITMIKMAIFTRWVKQKVKCKIKDNTGEIIEVIDVIDDEIDSDNYEIV